MFDWIFGFLGSGLNSIFKGWFDTSGGSDLLPGSSFHAITAAFATQGYWAQADFIYFINETGFQSFAILIYLCALIAGVVGMAMGAPPKQYLWYFMGPALFHFLLGTTQPVYGTAWKVGGTIDYQFEVWKLAETGLQSTNIAKRDGISISAYKGPSEPVNVSWFFAQFDAVVSSTVETFIGWLGVNLLDGEGDQNSNTAKPPSPQGYNTGGRWHLISNLKWGYLESIASARLTSPELRDGFINFMAGRCGDVFQESIDAGRYMSAAKSESGSIPPGIFATKVGTNSVSYRAVDYADFQKANTTYNALDNKMDTPMPMPIAFRRLFPQSSAVGTTAPSPEPGSLEESLIKLQDTFAYYGSTSGGAGGGGTPAGNSNLQSIMQQGTISCRNYLDILVRGFRWEAANLYFNLEKQLPPGAKQTQNVNGVDVSGVLEYAMLYGWEVQKYQLTDLFDSAGSKDLRETIMEKRGTPVDSAGQRQYLINLIFINMMKNEFLLAPNAMSRKIRLLSSEQASNAIEMYQKTVGSRNKFGEIYSWARMMPYLQGLLLYILALGYPFACVMILLPRCSKILFTWSSFWIWAKLWDLGFAIVVILERSVWATIGNSAKATQMNPFIVQMSDWGKTNLGPISGTSFLPEVIFQDAVTSGKGPHTSYMFLDRAMTLFSNMDLDLQNSFYIYIMAALYFAVPAITGQLVLGGKASIANMVTGAFQNMAQEVGSRAGRQFSQVLGKHSEAASAAADQAMYAKNLGKNNLLANALNTQNLASASQLEASYLGARDAGIGAKASIASSVAQRRDADLKYSGGVLRNIAASAPTTVGGYALLAGSSVVDALGVKSKLSGVDIPNVSFDNILTQANKDVSQPGPTTQGVPGFNNFSDNAVSNGINGTGGPTTGNIGGSVNGVGGPVTGNTPKSQNAPQFTWNALVAAVDAVNTGGSYTIQRDNIDRQAGYQADRSQAGVDRFGLSSDADRLQKEQQYQASFAKGYSQDNTFLDKAGYQTQLAESGVGVMDIPLGNLGSKSMEDTYLARSGLAGSAAQEASMFFSSNGAYAQDLKGFSASLNTDFGKTSLDNFYSTQVSSGVGEFQKAYLGIKDLSAQTVSGVLGSVTSLDGNNLTAGTLGAVLGGLGNGTFPASGNVAQGGVVGADGLIRDSQGQVIPNTFQRRNSGDRAPMNSGFEYGARYVPSRRQSK
jgi:hypothetical protein